MTRTTILAASAAVVALGAIVTLRAARTEAREPALRLAYGAAQQMGLGRVRAYVLTDASGVPQEIGVALDERALDGLPSSGTGHEGGHGPLHRRDLALPAEHGTPFRFVELNWNPNGHEPDGVYQDVPHFDFHFYTVSQAARDSIAPSDPQYAEKANRLPAPEFVPPSVAVLGPPGAPPAAIAVPGMGVHWVDLRSAELQKLLGKPDQYKPFTTTFILGSWDGRFHFWEPMITRAHIVAKKTATDPAVANEVIQLPTPTRYQVAGRYPTAYRIAWDAEAREYRIALTGLVQRD